MRYILLIFLLILPLTTDAEINALREEINRLRGVLFELYIQRDLSAESYLVTNLSQGRVVAHKNTKKQYPIASITKMMSSAVALENIDPQERVTLSARMLEPYGHSPSLFLGLNVSAQNLLKASLIQSTNDASEALTFFLEEGEFLRLMNSKAEEIGMHNTIFYDAHGLNPSNRSTALDLTRLLVYVYQNHPWILETTKDDNFWLPDSRGVWLKFKNVNNFHSHSDFLGSKTGYLPQAKQTFVALFNFNGDLFAVTLLYSKNRQRDMEKILYHLNGTKTNPGNSSL